MNIDFTKMQAQGNDFLIVNSNVLQLSEIDKENLARQICHRNLGFGADGLVLLSTNKSLPVMEIYNSDGSRARMCGSALRCVVNLIYKNCIQDYVDIQTDSGIYRGYIESTKTEFVMIEMPEPKLLQANQQVLNFTGDVVDTGNLHFVTYVTGLDDNPHMKYGKSISENEVFADGINVEFAQIISPEEIKLVVWERGAGVTLACGTGTLACVYAGRQKKLLQKEVLVHLPGGSVTISQKNSSYFLSGEVSIVGQGSYLWRI